MSRILDEALEKLNLQEAFSDSAPSWLKDRLQNGAAWSRNKPLKGGNLYSDRKSKKSATNSLFDLLLKTGYNVSKMNVVSAPVPQTWSDPIFEDPDKLPVLHVVTDDDDQVYIPGINDNFKYMSGGREIAFKYLFGNNSQLKKLVKDFAYIDLTSEDTHIKDDVLGRDELNKVRYSGKPDYSTSSAISYYAQHDKNQRMSNAQRGKLSSYKTSGFDKSGYYRGDEVLSDRLRDVLKKYKTEQLPKIFLDLEQKIIDTRQMILSQSRLGDDGKINTQKNSINQTIRYFNKLTGIIDQYQTYSSYINPTTGQFPNWVDYNSVKRYIIDPLNDLRKELQEFELSGFIW